QIRGHLVEIHGREQRRQDAAAWVGPLFLDDLQLGERIAIGLQRRRADEEHCQIRARNRFADPSMVALSRGKLVFVEKDLMTFGFQSKGYFLDLGRSGPATDMNIRMTHPPPTHCRFSDHIIRRGYSSSHDPHSPILPALCYGSSA